MIAEEGYGSPEDLRDVLEIPPGRLIARPHTLNNGVVDIVHDARRDVLWHALMLGLCTSHIYDPTRPVLWTQASAQAAGRSSSTWRASTHERTTRFRAILVELIDENPFAIRAVLRILERSPTPRAVETLTVTCADRPRLLVNLAFVSEHCACDEPR